MKMKGKNIITGITALFLFSVLSGTALADSFSACGINFNSPWWQAKDGSGNTVLIIDTNGNMFVNSSTVNSGTAPPVTLSNSLVIRNTTSNVFSFNKSETYITGSITQDAATIQAEDGNDLMVKNSSGINVAKFDGGSGNIYLTGSLCDMSDDWIAVVSFDDQTNWETYGIEDNASYSQGWGSTPSLTTEGGLDLDNYPNHDMIKLVDRYDTDKWFILKTRDGNGFNNFANNKLDIDSYSDSMSSQAKAWMDYQINNNRAVRLVYWDNEYSSDYFWKLYVARHPDESCVSCGSDYDSCHMSISWSDGTGNYPGWGDEDYGFITDVAGCTYETINELGSSYYHKASFTMFLKES